MLLRDIILPTILCLDLVCIITVIFFERKNAASTIAWVMVLVFFPVFGFLGYMLLGNGYRVDKRKKYAQKKISDDFYNSAIIKKLNIACNFSTSDINAAYTRMIDYLEREGRGSCTRDNNVTVYTDGETCFAQMMQDMRNAKKHIHLLYYIFRHDSLGLEILDILEEKARNGVEVRIIYDSIGSKMSFSSVFDRLRAAGGEAKPFAPFMFDISSQLRINYRNHRKITVIDGCIGYTGGMNIGDEYRGRDKKLHPWRDTQLRITGSAVWFLQKRFLMDWVYISNTPHYALAEEGYFPPVTEAGSLGVQIVSSGPDIGNSPIKSGFLDMLYAARNNIFIQSPYFTPDDSFMEALKIAAGAGVDVRVMIPGLSDHPLVRRINLAYVQEALDYGIKIYRYDGFLHAKSLMVDGLVASIGSSNIGNRSFTINFELNAFIYDAAFTRRYEEIFLQDQQRCIALNKDWFASQTMPTLASYKLVRILSPLM